MKDMKNYKQRQHYDDMGTSWKACCSAVVQLPANMPGRAAEGGQNV